MRRDANDPDRKLWLVFVDGIQQQKCFAANDAEGWAEIAALNATGNLVWTGEAPWNVETRMVWGKVEFRPNPAALAQPDAMWADPICRPPMTPGRDDQREMFIPCQGRIMAQGGPVNSGSCRVRVNFCVSNPESFRKNVGQIVADLRRLAEKKGSA